jgi:glutamate-ammonia-ligase adenylyltransferase
MLQLVDLHGRRTSRSTQAAPPRVLGQRRKLFMAFEGTPASTSPADGALDAAATDLRLTHRALLKGMLTCAPKNGVSCDEIALRLTEEAERCIASALEAALAYLAVRTSPAPGECVLLGLGKLGGREMTLGSDLDIVFVYEAAPGACPHEAAAYFDRVAKITVGLLNRSQQQERLYEVDVRLRPHGEDGPLATPLSAFGRYYDQDCWSWELLALARGRCVAGSARLQATVTELLRGIHARAGRRPSLARDVAEMRALLDVELPAQSVWDLKRAAGGLMDIEFLAQTQQLLVAGQDAELHLETRLKAALRALAALGRLRSQDAALLGRAASLYQTVQHVQRMAGVTDLQRAARPYRQLASQAAGGTALPALRRRLANFQREVRPLFEHYVGRTEGAAAVWAVA